MSVLSGRAASRAGPASLLAAVIAAGIATSPHHSLIDIATPVLSVVSIFVPYVGILLMSDLRRPEATDPLGPSVVAATCWPERSA